MWGLLTVLGLLSQTFGAQAILVDDHTRLPQTEYDFVVVGAGNAGALVAARLTENPHVSVLVIEAGGNDAGVEGIEVPFLAPNNLNNASLIWNYTTVPQAGLNGRVTPLQRGKVLGGSSSLNFLFYTRGSRDDFDRYANVTGDQGWSWDEILPLMKKGEGFVPPTDHRNITDEFEPAAHGFTGGLHTTVPNFLISTDKLIIDSTEVAPSEFPFNLDMNSGNTVGVGWTPSTSGGGQRSSSSTAYLHPALNRSNLDVLINTQVTKLFSVGHEHGTPALRGVQFAKNSTGPRFNVTAKKEVVLSAGAINSPQLLMLSGVGDDALLASYGIPTILNSSGVGKNLMDHPLLSAQYDVNSNFSTLDPILANVSLSDASLAQWQANRTGVFADVVSNQIAWLRLPANSSIFQEFGDPSAGPTSSHIEIVPTDFFSPPSVIHPETAQSKFVTGVLNVVNPLSRGNVTLNTTDPFDFPLIDPGYMTHPLDVLTMVQALGVLGNFFSTTPWQGVTMGPFGTLANATTDSALEEFIRNGVATFWHPAGTAKMGNSSDETAVVDSHLRIKGASGIRVVDASVLPYLPAAHPQAAVYAIAERASLLIQQTWGI